MRVPPIPPDIPYHASVKDHQSQQAKIFMRREVLDRLGLGRSYNGTVDLRYCLCHKTESGTFKVKTQIRNRCGRVVSTINENIELTGLPIPSGRKAAGQPAETASKGLGGQCRVLNILCDTKCENTMALQQSVEITDIENGRQVIEDIPSLIRLASGLHVHPIASLRDNRTDAIKTCQ